MIIPQTLKNAVGIKSEITVAGVLNKIEIWPKERYDAQLDAVLKGQDAEMNLAKMTEEAFALLGDEVAEEDESVFATAGAVKDWEVIPTPTFGKATAKKGEV